MSRLINVFLAGLFILVALEGYSSVKTDLVEKCINRLDAFTENEELESSGLTFEDLIAAAEEFLTWPVEIKAKIEEEYPQITAMEKFLIYPLQRHVRHLGRQIPDAVKANYVRRLETNYRFFRPAFFGRQVGEGDYYSTAVMNDLKDALKSVPGSKPLTKNMVLRANDQFLSMQKRLVELDTADDIFSNLDELRLILNFLNTRESNILRNHIFPQVPSLKDKASLDRLKIIFAQQNYLQGYEIKNGKYVPINQTPQSPQVNQGSSR